MTARCVSAVLALTAIGNLVPAADAIAQTTDHRYVGDWYVSDQTDNVTGEREVYAFQNHFPPDQPGYVSLTMRCSSGKPVFFVDWSELSFPDQSVITIVPMVTADGKAAGKGYVFEKSGEAIESGLKATPAESANIVSALSGAKFAAITVRPVSGARTVKIEVHGAQAAWTRISRHCPVRIVSVPPM